MSEWVPGSGASQSEGSQGLVYWLPSLSSMSSQSNSDSSSSGQRSGGPRSRQGSNNAPGPEILLQPQRAPQPNLMSQPHNSQMTSGAQQGMLQLMPPQDQVPYSYPLGGVSAELSGRWSGNVDGSPDMQTPLLPPPHLQGNGTLMGPENGYRRNGAQPPNIYQPWRVGILDNAPASHGNLPLDEGSVPITRQLAGGRQTSPPQGASNMVDGKLPQHQYRDFGRDFQEQGTYSGSQQPSQPPPEEGPLAEQAQMDADGGYASLGSAQHAAGLCSPCVFWFKNQCVKGAQCRYCHLVHSGQKNKRIRPSKRTREQRRGGVEDELAGKPDAACRG